MFNFQSHTQNLHVVFVPFKGWGERDKLKKYLTAESEVFYFALFCFEGHENHVQVQACSGINAFGI